MGYISIIATTFGIVDKIHCSEFEAGLLSIQNSEYFGHMSFLYVKNKDRLTRYTLLVHSWCPMDIRMILHTPLGMEALLTSV